MDVARSTPGPPTTSIATPPCGDGRALGPGHHLADELFERLHSTRDLVAFLEKGSLDGTWIWDLEHRDQLWATHRFRELLGFGDQPDVDADLLKARIHPEDAAAVATAFERHLADPAQPYDQVVRYRHRDGSTVWVRSRGFALYDDDGRPVRFVGVHTDLTGAMRAQEALAASVAELAAYSGMLERVDRITTALQGLGEPSEVEASLVRVLGREVGELCLVVEPGGDTGYQVLAADAVDEIRLAELVRLVGEHAPGTDDRSPLGTVMRSGDPLLLSDVTGPELLRDIPPRARAEVAAQLPRSLICVPWMHDGDRGGAVLVARFGADLGSFLDADLALVRQIVARHEATHRQLVSQLENQVVGRFRELARSAPMGILQIDADGACTFANDHWTALTGRDHDESLGAGWIEVFRPDDLQRLRAGWAASLESGEVYNAETRILTRDGRPCWVAASAVAQSDEVGHYTGALIVVSDVTARRRAEQELSAQARIDSVTGIANRFALFESIDQALTDLHGSPDALGVVYLDVDTFKEVNDSLGHEVGDRLLAAVGRRVGGVLREGDLCARVGGDEFVVLLHPLEDRAAAAAVAERIRLAMREPFSLSGVLVHTSASVGVVTVDRDDGVIRADEVLRRADRAMYRAKRAGGDRWVVFSGEMDEQARSEAAVRQEIADAIDQGRIVLHHQPIVDLTTGALVGMEALVRIQHPTRGMLAPAEFLDVAERSGQIVAIGRWVVRESCRQLARWHRTDPELYLSLNLSGRQVADAGMADMVLGAVAEFGVRPDRLVVEVTETTLVKAASSATAAIDRIRGAGVRIAIDDFGTGWSSLARLTEISANMVKIDRSFVSSAPQDPMRAAIISAVMHLAGLVGLDVVAEGIETEEQRRTLLELGCRTGQGYLFGRPVPATEVPGLGRVLL